jgi:hypothetical protein
MDPRLDTFNAAPGAGSNLANRFDETAVVIETDETHALLALSVANLAARLWPNTRVVGPAMTIGAPPFGDGDLTAVAASLVAAASLSNARSVARTITVALGVPSPSATLYATSDRWSSRVGRRPVDVLSGDPGPATTATAALIAAEIFRIVVPEMPGVRLTESVEWNLVNYRRSTLVGPSMAVVQATCFGGGSVGSSLVLALLVSKAKGELTVVDDDALQARNRLRYPLWIMPARGRKVDWLASLCTAGTLAVIGVPATAQAYGATLEKAPALAIAAVDTVDGRAAIAEVLALETLNAGVDGLQLHVARHRFGDGLACVYCGYVDAAPPSSELDVYVVLTGLSRMRVAQLLSGERLADADVAAMIASHRLDPQSATDLAGGRLMDVARARLYAQAAIPALGDARVAAPFVSALAGAVLAAEVLKSAETRLDRRVDIDLSGWPTGLTSRPKQDPTRRCLCWSPLRRRAYDSMWPVAHVQPGSEKSGPKATS